MPHAETSSRWSGVPVLVTGARGFVGSRLAARLAAEGALVLAPPRVELDVTDEEAVLRALRENGVRAVFHLASQSIAEVAQRSPRPTWEANVRGTWCVLDACRAAREEGEGPDRVVVSSSALAYGDGLERASREDDPLLPVHPYAVSKAAADLIARSHAATHGLPVAVTRMANVYGGGDLAYSRLVPDACRALVNGERPVLRSDGTPEREVLYVEDAVEAYLAVAASLDDPARAGRAWNAGSGEAPQVIEVVRRLIAISGRGLEPDVQGQPRGVRDRRALDSTALREELGWFPAWDLDRGLAATFAWYREHLGGEAPAA